MLSKAKTVAETPYQAYQGPRIAEFGADTLASFDSVRNASNESSQAFSAAIDAAKGAMAYQAPSVTSRDVALPAAVRAGLTSAQQVALPDNVTTGKFDYRGLPDVDLEGYLNPYRENVLDVQKMRAEKAFAEQRAARDASAVQAGAFGGDRRFVQDSIANRDFNEQLQYNEATGLQAAFDTATKLFQTDEERRLGAYNADSNRQLTADTGNADRAVTVNTGNADRSLRSDMGNVDRTFSADSGNADRYVTVNTGNADRAMSASAANASAANAAAANRVAAIGTMGNLATGLQSANLTQAQALSGVGAKLDQRDQAGLDLAYQDFLRQQNYPAAQVGFYSDILRGVPAGSSSSVATTEPAPDFLSQLIGLGTTVAGTVGSLK